VKKIKRCLPLLVIVVLTVGLTFDVIIPNAYSLSYSEQVSDQKNNMWHLGKNLSVGDSYTYKICDPGAIQTSAANYHYFTQGNENHNSSVCYVIKMDFVNLLNSDENLIDGDVWVVQAAISDVTATNSDDVRYSVFHVDAQIFEVRSADTIHPDTIRYTDSLQKTLFSLFKYTAPEPQLLQTKTEWGEVTEALHERGANPHMTVLDNNREYSVTQNSIRMMIDKQDVPVAINITDAFKVGYEIDIFDPFIISDDKKKKMMIKEDNNNVTNYFLIYSDLPFPLSAVSYSPVHTVQPQKQFEFELVMFLANNKNFNIGMKPVFEEPKDIIVSDLPTETGTIALTFPADDDVVQSDDIVVDDIVVDDIVVDDIVVDDIVVDDIVVDDIVVDDIVVDDIVVDDDGVQAGGDDANPTQLDNVDYSKIAGLVVLLVVMITVFVIFKKFKESGFDTGLKNKLKKKQQQHTVKEIVAFDDKLHIDITTLTDGNN